MRNYDDILNQLHLDNINVIEVIQKPGYDIVSIEGGLRDFGGLDLYLNQVLTIFNQLSKCGITWLIDWNTSCADDYWIVRLGVQNSENI